jgi:hypothetical protein
LRFEEVQALKKALETIAVHEKRIANLEKIIADLAPKKPGRPKKDSHAKND